MNYCDFLGSYCNFTFHGASYTRWRNAQTLENFEKYKSWSLSQMELKFLMQLWIIFVMGRRDIIHLF